VAILGDEIVQVTLAAEAGGAGAGRLAQVLECADVRDRSDDFGSGQPLAVAENVVVGFSVLHESAANDAVRHVAPATGTCQGAIYVERRHHSRLEVVRPYVLLDLQLDPVATWPQAGRSESALHLEVTLDDMARPVAVDVHVAGEQRPVVAPNSDDEDRLR